MNDKVAQTIQDRDYEAGECVFSWNEAGEHTRDYYRATAKLVLSAEPDTHELKIVKKGEPQLLSDKEIADVEEVVDDCVFSGVSTDTHSKAVAKAQRSRDIEYYKG